VLFGCFKYTLELAENWRRLIRKEKDPVLFSRMISFSYLLSAVFQVDMRGYWRVRMLWRSKMATPSRKILYSYKKVQRQ